MSRSTWGKVFGAIWYLIVCIVFLSIGCFGGMMSRSKRFSVLQVLNPKPPQDTFHADVQTFLILGCDEDYKTDPKSYGKRAYRTLTGHTPEDQLLTRNAARSDMMMVARMDFAKGEITGVSIPRDTWCQLPGYSEHKINAYHAIAKEGQENELAKQAVTYLIGVPIDKVIVVSFDKMQKLVDLMGGVYVTVPRQMDYDDNAGMLHIHLKPGYQKLNGYQAMGYVRFRHSQHAKSYESDFQRQQREKDMLLGLKDSAKANWTHIAEIADAGADVIGDALDNDQILSLASFIRRVGQQNIRIGVIPTREKGNGLQLEAEKLPKVLDEYKLGDNASRVTLR